MAVQSRPAGPPEAAVQPWYTRTADEVLAALDVDPAVGLSAARAAELLAANGPNALPEEKPPPGWRRFLDQYRSLHADHPGRGGRGLAGDQGVEHRGSC